MDERLKRVCVFDVETTYGEYLGRKGSPFAPGEIDLCASGFSRGSDYTGSYLVAPDRDGIKRGVAYGSQGWKDSFPSLDGFDVLVGHNIKFDLLWYWRHPELERFLKRGGVIWDTAYADYLLSGQFYNLKQMEHLRPSLEMTAKRRKVTLKLDVVKAMWDQGIRTEDIQEQVLMEYLQGDVRTTQEIYLDQLAQAENQNQLHMIVGRMDGLLATTEMEFNGLQIDLVEAERRLVELTARAEGMEAKLKEFEPKMPEGMEFNWGSPGQLSCLLFGGKFKYEAKAAILDDTGNFTYYQTKERRPVLDADGNQVYFKGGKNAGKPKTKLFTVPDIDRGPKTRFEDFWWELPGLTKPMKKWRTASSREDESKPVRYSTSEDILNEVGKRDIEAVTHLLDLRGLLKDIGTYYRRFFKGKWTGMLTMVGDDARIHHSLNHYITKTSRLSSSKPNLQNLSGTGKSEVRKMFVSRFGDDGYVSEGDYSQLEVVCKAVLSGDPELKRKLLIGLCLHCDWLSLSPMAEGKSYEEVYDLCKVQHDPVWTAKRKKIKPVTFGEAYGAGVPSLCESSGMAAEDIEAAIAKRKATYPLMYQYDEDNIAKVKASRRPSQIRTENGYQAGIGYLRTCTDTIYHFMENDAMEWQRKQGIMTSFTPTTIKNYPSQGLGGEIMQVSLGRLFRWILENDRFDDKLLLINTVHDCVWIDVHKDYVKYLAVAKMIMEDVSPYFNLNYPNVDWDDMPFPVEFEIGPNMYDLEVMHTEG